MTTNKGTRAEKLGLRSRWWAVAVAALAVLVGGAWALPMAIGSGPVLDGMSKEPASSELIVPASETARVSPPLNLDTRIPVEALSVPERVAAGVVSSAVGVIDKTADELPIDDAGLGFGELRVLLRSGEVARFSWQRWDAAWDFEEFAAVNPQARRVDLGAGRIALYMDPGGSRRSVSLWTGGLLVTITVRSAVDGVPPTTGIEEVARWTVEFAARLVEAGF